MNFHLCNLYAKAKETHAISSFLKIGTLLILIITGAMNNYGQLHLEDYHSFCLA